MIEPFITSEFPGERMTSLIHPEENINNKIKKSINKAFDLKIFGT